MRAIDVDRRRFSQEELHDLAEQGQLPGFLSPATFGPELFEDTAWQPVHNVSIIQLDQGKPYEPSAHLSIRTAIRRQETNPTHPDVVSTPTRRMTTVRAQELIAERMPFVRPSSQHEFELTEVNPQRPQTVASFEPNLTALYHSEILPAVVRELLEAKMGLGDLTGDEQILWNGIGRASLAKVVTGFSYVADSETGDPLYEPIVMFGSVLSSGVFPLPLPQETADYRNMTWTPVGEFASNVENRNVAGLVIASEWDEVYACVRGLCLATSVRTTSDLQDVWRHMGYEQSDPYRHSRDPLFGGLDVITIL
jgi:hypothetical protein